MSIKSEVYDVIVRGLTTATAAAMHLADEPESIERDQALLKVLTTIGDATTRSAKEIRIMIARSIMHAGDGEPCPSTVPAGHDEGESY